jgi:hypothetical protein
MKGHRAPILAIIGFFTLFLIHQAFATWPAEQPDFPDPDVFNLPATPEAPVDERQPGPGNTPGLPGPVPDQGPRVCSLAGMAGLGVDCGRPDHRNPGDLRQAGSFTGQETRYRVTRPASYIPLAR